MATVTGLGGGEDPLSLLSAFEETTDFELWEQKMAPPAD
jgi:hypothetical protein